MAIPQHDDWVSDTFGVHPGTFAAPAGGADLAGEATYGTWLEYYNIALQGTAGLYDKPEIASKKAREIAEICDKLLKQRKAAKGSPEATFLSTFGEALQGTAGKYKEPAVAAQKALDIAEASGSDTSAENIKLHEGRTPPADVSQYTDKDIEIAVKGGIWLEYYHLVLPAVSGQIDKPKLASKFAGEIAEACGSFLKSRIAAKGRPDQQFLDDFKNALQGTAAKYNKAAQVVSKATEIAELAGQQESKKANDLNGGKPPPTDVGKMSDEDIKIAVKGGMWLEYYKLALQGTSGQLDKPQAASDLASKIADACIAALLAHKQAKGDNDSFFLKVFKEALPGTAQKYADAITATKRAVEIAEAAAPEVAAERKKTVQPTPSQAP